MRHSALLLLAAVVMPCAAAVISSPLAFVENVNGDLVTTPAYLGGGDNHRLFFRFDVPDGASITSLNSFKVTVDTVDDDDRADEFYFVSIAGGLDLFLGGDAPSIGAQYFADPLDFGAILAAIQDNNRIPLKLERCCGDMFVQSVTLEIDANLVGTPEPASIVMALSAIVSLSVVRRRRRIR